jgi:hypothetical protein
MLYGCGCDCQGARGEGLAWSSRSRGHLAENRARKEDITRPIGPNHHHANNRQHGLFTNEPDQAQEYFNSQAVAHVGVGFLIKKVRESGVKTSSHRI